MGLNNQQDISYLSWLDLFSVHTNINYMCSGHDKVMHQILRYLSIISKYFRLSTTCVVDTIQLCMYLSRISKHFIDYQLCV